MCQVGCGTNEKSHSPCQESDHNYQLHSPSLQLLNCVKNIMCYSFGGRDRGLMTEIFYEFNIMCSFMYLLFAEQGTIFKNYNSIRFFPWKFTEYLLSPEVGFTQCEVIGTPFHQSRGFQRPLQLFTKGENTPSRSAASSTSTPSRTDVTGASRPPVYMPVSISSREVGDDDNDDVGDTVGRVGAAHNVEECNVPAEELVAMGAGGTETLEDQDCVHSRSVDGRFHENVGIRSCVPVIRDSDPPDSDGGITAMSVDKHISNMGSHLIVNEGKDTAFDSGIVFEQVYPDIKSEVGGIVSDTLMGHKEVVSVRVAKVHINSKEFACDGESVKMETNSSSNET